MFHYLPTYCKKRLGSANLAHVQALKNSFTQSVHHPLESTGCSSGPDAGHQVIQTYLSNAVAVTISFRTFKNALQEQDNETENAWKWLKMHLLRRAIAKMCKGLQAKHSHVAGCLVEERRPLTARWPFPNLAEIHSRFLGPAKKSIFTVNRSVSI